MRMTRAIWPSWVFLLGVVLVLGACGGDDQTSTSASPTPSEAATESDTEEAPDEEEGTDEEASGSEDEEGATQQGQESPAAAAQGLFDAWQQGDRDLAAQFATQGAIAELFTHEPSAMQFMPPCHELEDEPGTGCFFYYEGGGLNMVVGDSDVSGYFVTRTFFVAD